MSHFSDSRDPGGIGFLILQDHGYKTKDQKDYQRGGLVGVRVLGKDDADNGDGKWEEDEWARGMLGGGYHWGRQADNAGAYQFIWPVVISAPGSETSSGLVNGVPTVDTVNLGNGGDGGGGRPRSKYGVPLKSDGTTDWEQAEKEIREGKLAADQPTTQKIRNEAAKASGRYVKGVWAERNMFGFGIDPFPVFGANPKFKIGGAFGFAAAPLVWKNGYDIPQGLRVDDPRINSATWKDAPESARLQMIAKSIDDLTAAWVWMGDDVTETALQTEFYPADSARLPDRRYSRKRTVDPLGWCEFPRGFQGLSTVSSREHEQVEQFHPTDPRLVCPNFSGPVAVGTPVADMGGPSDSLSLGRHAPIQSQWRVIVAPDGDNGFLAKNGKLDNPRNWIARQIGPSGQGDVCGGLVCDIESLAAGFTGTKKDIGRIVLGMESVRDGGPFDVGGFRDRHVRGADGDGHTINSLHISTAALFKVRGDNIQDGPIKFEPYFPEFAGELLYPIFCHLGWRQSTQQWEIYTTSEIYEPGPTITPVATPDPEITPPEHPPYRPRTPVGSLTPEDNQNGVAVMRELASPALTFRPQLISSNVLDNRYGKPETREEVAQYDATTPITLRMEAFGRQGGPVAGPHLGAAGDWIYTQNPRHSRSVGGTSYGGIALIVPELDMSHVDSSFAPGVSKSTSYFVATPGVCFGAGIPELSTGGLRDGHSWCEESGDLNFYAHDSAGAKTLVSAIGATGAKLRYVSVAANYDVADGIDVVYVTLPATITLPSAITNPGRMIHVKSKGIAVPVTVNATAGNVDGDASQVVGGLEAITVQSDSVDWWVI